MVAYRPTPSTAAFSLILSNEPSRPFGSLSKMSSPVWRSGRSVRLARQQLVYHAPQRTKSALDHVACAYPSRATPPGDRWPRWPLPRLTNRPLHGRLGSRAGPTVRLVAHSVRPEPAYPQRYSARRTGGAEG